MSMYAVVDFTVHFDEFRNVDLFNQGVYHHRVTAYVDGHDPEGKSAVKKKNKKNAAKNPSDFGRADVLSKFCAKPIGLFSSPPDKLSIARGVIVAGSNAFSAPARIDESDGSFHTRR